MTDPISAERFAEIRDDLAAITTNRPAAYADRDRARDRWTLNSSDYAAELVTEVDRLTAELAKAQAIGAMASSRYLLRVDTWNGTIQLRCADCKPEPPATGTLLIDSEIYGGDRPARLARMATSAAKHEAHRHAAEATAEGGPA